MEPLTEEYKKLKEAGKLMEKNIQRAQREWDLAESKPRTRSTKKSPYSSS